MDLQCFITLVIFLKIWTKGALGCFFLISQTITIFKSKEKLRLADEGPAVSSWLVPGSPVWQQGQSCSWNVIPEFAQNTKLSSARSLYNEDGH